MFQITFRLPIPECCPESSSLRKSFSLADTNRLSMGLSVRKMLHNNTKTNVRKPKGAYKIDILNFLFGVYSCWKYVFFVQNKEKQVSTCQVEDIRPSIIQEGCDSAQFCKEDSAKTCGNLVT